MTAKIRRTYAGAAVETTLATGMDSDDTSIVVSSTTGWASGSFYVVIDPGTASEEKVLIASRAGSTLTVLSRGVDGTTAKSHSEGAVIYPVATAVDFDEANELTATYQNTGGMVYKDSTTFAQLALGTNGYPLVASASAPTYAQLTATGIANNAVTTDKINAAAVTAAKLASQVAGSGLVGGAGDALAVNVDDSTLEIQSDTVQIKDAGVTLAKLASAVQNLLVPVGTIAMYGGATAPTGWLLCDGSAIDAGYTALRAIVGANTPDFKGRFALGDNSTLTLLGTGGSTTIGVNNLPAHSHSNTAVLANGTVSITDNGHQHGGETAENGAHTHSIAVDELTSVADHGHGIGSQVMAGSGSSPDGDNTSTSAIQSAGTHKHGFTTNSATTGISASVGTAITVTNANTGGGEAYYQPHVVVNYIIKHD
jgi:microcystin-dependent protein